ncbi:MAG: phosphoribosylformimino-5-aminoimidazole carboxamide ribotide isomerase [Akkermansiaceae bacterium]
MTKFRPCIDLHDGKVKQIVGGTLTDNEDTIKENFVSDKTPASFADLYRQHNLTGGHIIQLGQTPGNKQAALSALAAWPNGMQIGGGITLENAAEWLTAGASHIIVTSYLFAPDGTFLPERLTQLASEIGKENLVIDLSCRRTKDTPDTTSWTVAMNRWQTLTNLHITPENLDHIAQHCDELLVHAADVEGLCKGIDQQLVQLLGQWAAQSKLPITYAGGATTIADIHLTHQHSLGNVDITVGSALDIFGGTGMTLTELTAWNNQ